MDNINGIKTTVDFGGDLQMDPYWKMWTRDDVFTCVRYARSGLVLLIDPNGKTITVPKRVCNALGKDK